MEKIECKKSGSVFGRRRGPDASEIYRQNKAKPLENETPREENPHNRGKWLHHGRGAHHGQTVATTMGRGVHHGLAVVPTGGGGPLFPVRCVLGSFGASPWAAGFAFSWVFWASLQASFDPHGPHFISLDSSQTFLPKSWLESWKSAISIQQTKTERNRRKYA